MAVLFGLSMGITGAAAQHASPQVGSTTMVISQIQSRGAESAYDEFVELFTVARRRSTSPAFR